jgi:HhH-GPD superfamily base excision DNA repair protein
MTTAAVADPTARAFLRKSDPVLARVIDAHPDFRPRAWIDELPRLDAFRTLVFQVVGQQLSVRATRTILSRLEEHFGGHLPSPAELLAADPQVLRASGMSARKAATLHALAERFVDGRLSDDALASMTDKEIEGTLTEVSGIGPWTAHGFRGLAVDGQRHHHECGDERSVGPALTTYIGVRLATELRGHGESGWVRYAFLLPTRQGEPAGSAESCSVTGLSVCWSSACRWSRRWRDRVLQWRR